MHEERKRNKGTGKGNSSPLLQRLRRGEKGIISCQFAARKRKKSLSKKNVLDVMGERGKKKRGRGDESPPPLFVSKITFMSTIRGRGRGKISRSELLYQ